LSRCSQSPSSRARSPATCGIAAKPTRRVVKALIDHHAKLTGSRRAREILEKWADYRPRFVKVFPKEYRRALGELAAQKKAAA